MNKKLIISLGIIAAISSATLSAFADTTIYTDSIGRLHFLGRDAKSNTDSGYNFKNSAEQDLTRRLYEQSEAEAVNDTTYDQHPLKNYENTFPDSRFGTAKYWKTKYANNDENLGIDKPKESVKATATATKGVTDYSNPYAYGTTILDNNTENVKPVAKKHWWNRNK